MPENQEGQPPVQQRDSEDKPITYSDVIQIKDRHLRHEAIENIVAQETLNEEENFKKKNPKSKINLRSLAHLTAAARRFVAQGIVKERLKQKVAIDNLTGLPNRNFMNPELNRLITKSLRSNAPIWGLMVDIDWFKNVNDVFGHQVGDRILKTAADVFRQIHRENEPVARWGGEEFLQLVNSDITEEQLAKLMRRYSEAFTAAASPILAEAEPMAGADPQKIRRVATFSMGAAQFNPAEHQSRFPDHKISKEALEGLIRSFIDTVDKNALYRAKHLGRNRGIIISPHPKDPENPYLEVDMNEPSSPSIQ